MKFKKKTTHFKRTDNDLFCTKKITLSQSLHGFDFEFKELGILRQGNLPSPPKFIIRERSIIHPNMIRKIPNLGLPYVSNPHQFGHVYVRYIVEYPKSIDSNWISNLQKSYDKTFENKDIDNIYVSESCQIKADEIYKGEKYNFIS